jgi:hypothetical protein
MARIDKAPDLWEEVVEKVCAEWQAGTLAYSDAVDDLVFLGFDAREARAVLGTADQFTGAYLDAILSRGRASPPVPRR